MTAVGANRWDPQRDLSFANSLYSTVGDDLTPLSCDLGDVNSTEFQQLLLQGLSDPFLLDLHSFQLGPPGALANDGASACDLTSFLLEDVARPRDLNISCSGEFHGKVPAPDLSSTFFEGLAGPGTSNEADDSLAVDHGGDHQQHQQQPPNNLPLFHSPFKTAPALPVSLNSSAPASMFDLPAPGSGTPPHCGGVTPPDHGSRAASPAWSESSSHMSCCSSSSSRIDMSRMRLRHPSRSSVGSNNGEQQIGSLSIPRHKRPSHKRAEIKRRDKIKTCLEDMKDAVPSLQDKGKLSESAILIKAAEYIHHLKDGKSERGKKAAELQQEIESLSKEIHSFQDNLPATGLKEESASPASLDDLHQAWLVEKSQNSPKFCVFSAITSKMWDSFRELVGPTTNLSSLNAKAQEWQASYLALPVLRKQILAGLLSLSRQDSIVMTSASVKNELGSSVDALSTNTAS